MLEISKEIQANIREETIAIEKQLKKGEKL